MTSHSTTTVTTDDFSSKKIFHFCFMLGRTLFVLSAAGHGLQKNVFTDDGRDGILYANKIIGTRFGMHVATALFARRFVKGISTAIAFVSDDIINTVFAKRLAVARREAIFGQ